MARRIAAPNDYGRRYARCVRVLVRGSLLAASMSSYLTSRLEADPGIKIEYNSEVTALEGDEHLESVTIRNAEIGQSRKGAARRRFRSASSVIGPLTNQPSEPVSRCLVWA